MTFLIIAEDHTAGAGLAERIKERAPDSFCFSVSPSTVDEALKTVRVDCAVCPPELAESLSRRKLPRVAVWPPEASAEAMTEALLSHQA